MSTLSSNTLSSCSRCSRIYRNTKYKIQISHRTIESYKRINEKAYSLARDAVECSSFVLDVTIEISPKLNEEESCLWSFIVKFLETALLFGKFVVYLFNIDRFKQRVRVGCGTSYMDEQVFVVLKNKKKREIHACVSETVYHGSIVSSSTIWKTERQIFYRYWSKQRLFLKMWYRTIIYSSNF